MHWAPRPPWPGGDGRFTARYWDLQVPRSPGGAFLEAAHPLRTCKRLLGAAAAGVGWALAGELGASAEAPPRHSFAAPRLAFYLLPHLAPERRDGKTGPRLCAGAGAPTTSPGSLQGTSGSCRCSLSWPLPLQGRLPPRNLSSSPAFHARSC